MVPSLRKRENGSVKRTTAEKEMPTAKEASIGRRRTAERNKRPKGQKRPLEAQKTPHTRRPGRMWEYANGPDLPEIEDVEAFLGPDYEAGEDPEKDALFYYGSTEILKEEIGKGAIIQAAKDLLPKCDKTSKRRLEQLNKFLLENGIYGDNPYKEAMRKVRDGESMSKPVLKKIAGYIRLTLLDFSKFIRTLLSIKGSEWDDEIAGLLVDGIEEQVTKRLGVEVIDLEKLSNLAATIKLVPNRTLKMAVAEKVVYILCKWCYYSSFFVEAMNEWVKKPSVSFMSGVRSNGDVLSFDDF